jgi:hypothetical protein
VAKKISFIGLEIEQFTRKKEGTEISCACELTKAVLDKMEWNEAPECYKGGSLDGECTASVASFEPSEGTASRPGIDLDAVQLHSFKTVRLENKGTRGKGHRTELRFKITCGDLAAAQKIEGYFMLPGTSKLSITFEKVVKPTQAGFDDAEDTGCTACNNHVPLQPDNPRKHDNGVKCTARPVQSPLPS